MRLNRKVPSFKVLFAFLACCGFLFSSLFVLPVKAVAAAAPVCDISIFGPQKYARTTGAKNVYTTSITVPKGVTGATLNIRNGEPNGKNRVSSAVVELNGVQVARELDFNQGVAGLSRSVSLVAGTTITLKVTLASKPDSYLVIDICGRAEKSDETASPVIVALPPVNHAPSASADSYSTNEDQPLSVAAPGVMANDSDPDHDALTAAVSAGPSYGTLALQANGSFSYTPAAGFSGADSFTYVVSDGQLSSAPVAVSITVVHVNHAPTATNDTYSTNEDQPLSVAAPGVMANDSDPDHDSLTATVSAGPSHGTLVLQANGSFSYTPAAGFSGADSFSYVVSDGQLSSAPVAVNVQVVHVNHAPSASVDSYSTNEDQPLSVAAPGVMANDSDPDHDALMAAVTAGPFNGKLAMQADGSFIYTPASGFSGMDSFAYVVSDGQLSSAPVAVSITVVHVNHAPTATNDTYSTNEDQPLQVMAAGVLLNDSDPDKDVLTAALFAGPFNGTVAVQSDGSFLYTPVAGFSGMDSFTYTVSDGKLTSAPATVSMEVVHVNHAPTATSDSYSTNENQPLQVMAAGVLSNDSDPDKDVLMAVLSSGPSHGALSFQPNGSFSYTPAAGFSGMDSFAYTTNDGSLSSAPATVNITVVHLNRAPVAKGDLFGMTPGTTLSVAAPGVKANDTDPDGDSLLPIMVKQPSYGTVQLNADGSFAYTPSVRKPASALNAVVKWSWTSSSVLPDSINVLSVPIIIDLNGDGIPDVVFGSTNLRESLSLQAGNLRALRGDTGAELFTVTDMQINAASTVAAGDINGDGKPEIIACAADGKHLLAFTSDGKLIWQSPELEPINSGSPSLSDLDGDGFPEIVAGRQVLNHDGTIRWTGKGGRSPVPVVVDIDHDGKPEVLSGNTVYNADGAIKWQVPMPDSGYNAVGNFDTDQFPEIVLVSYGQVWLFEHNGTKKWGPVYVPGVGYGGPPTIADVDGDGKPEIGVAGAFSYGVLNGDGTQKWARPSQDTSSNVTGSSAFDFEGDGTADIVYRDEVALRIYRGKDGATLFEMPLSSCTWLEYPVVADLNRDGHAEIVVGANDNCGYGQQRGIYVFGDAANLWAPARGIWNEHAYHVTNINSNGTIPKTESSNWLTSGLNNFRQSAFGPGDIVRIDSFTYKLSDGSLESNIAAVVINAAPENHAPRIVSTPVTAAKGNEVYTYAVQAVDPDAGDVLLFTLGLAPAGMSIDSTTGLVQWTPNMDQLGTHDITIQVQDKTGLMDSQSFTITVTSNMFCGTW